MPYLSYQYGRTPRLGKSPLRLALLLVGTLLGGAGFWLWRDLRAPSGSVSSPTRIVGQVGTINKSLVINEPLFRLELPGDWRETGRRPEAVGRSITWQASTKGADNRYLTLFMDADNSQRPINRLAPVSLSDNRLLVRDVSDNCVNFTENGTWDVKQASRLKPAMARWQGVPFLCNLPSPLLGEAGASSGPDINTIRVRHSNGQTHSYFLLYRDLGNQPDYGLFTTILSSLTFK